MRTCSGGHLHGPFILLQSYWTMARASMEELLSPWVACFSRGRSQTSSGGTSPWLSSLRHGGMEMYSRAPGRAPEAVMILLHCNQTPPTHHHQILLGSTQIQVPSQHLLLCRDCLRALPALSSQQRWRIAYVYGQLFVGISFSLQRNHLNDIFLSSFCKCRNQVPGVELPPRVTETGLAELTVITSLCDFNLLLLVCSTQWWEKLSGNGK
jgi:hypothetical protein